MTIRVLLVDDDRELQDMLRDYLLADGFAVETAGDGEAGILAAQSGRFDIMVLDVMMPGKTGIEVLGRLRAQPEASAPGGFSGRTLPVIMLTARGDDADRIVGLELGADDYVAKPCSPRELAARIRAIMKRTGPSPALLGGSLIAGQLTLWTGERRAAWAGQPVDLTSSEFSVLEVLARNAGLIVSKAQLSQEALGRPLASFDRTVDVHVSAIRHKLGVLPDGRSCIQTVIRRGYLLVNA